MKDIDEKPDKEMQKVRSGRILSTKASVPMYLECQCGCVHLPGGSLNAILLGFYGGFIM